LTVLLTRRYPTPALAEAVVEAVAPDDAGFVTATREGDRVTFRVVSNEPRSARATLDDLLAGVAAAERTAAVNP
jgi:transcription factor Pcc1